MTWRDQPWANLLLREELAPLIFLTDEELKNVLRTKNTPHLMELVAEERGKYTESNKALLGAMVQELVDRKVYPTEWNGKPIDALKRVEGYGANWHEWKGPLNCTHCGADLRDQEHGPPFKREIGIYDDRRDRTVSYECPDCKKGWPR